MVVPHQRWGVGQEEQNLEADSPSASAMVGGGQGDSAQFKEGHGEERRGEWLNQLPSKPLSEKPGNEEVKFLINTGTTYSVLNTRKGKFSHKSVDVVGATGQKEN